MMWRAVSWHAGGYEVSEDGQLRSKDGAQVGQWMSDQGYMLARLSSPRTIVRVHRVVARAFCENPDGLPVVNHRDSDRAHNHWSNLEWCTQPDNLAHAQKLGRMQRDYWVGKRSPNAFLSDQTAHAIKAEYEAGGISWASLGRKHQISKRSVGRIVKGESYV